MAEQAVLFEDARLSAWGDELDFYETPAWAVQAIRPFIPWRDQRWGILEPAAGRGAIIDEVMVLEPCAVAAYELHPERFEELAERHRFVVGCKHADFLTANVEEDFPGLFPGPVLIPMNPPYTKPRPTVGLEFVEKALQVAGPEGCVVALLPLDFATGVDRCERIHDCYPGSVYPLRRRPHFGGPHSGQRPFAWFVWDLLNPKREWRVIG